MSGDFHCRHEGEIRSLQSQNADQYDKLSELANVPGLADMVREMKKEVDQIMQSQLTAEAVQAAVTAAMKTGVIWKDQIKPTQGDVSLNASYQFDTAADGAATVLNIRLLEGRQ